MRLPVLLLIGVVALSACGGQSGSSYATKACHSLDLNTGVAFPSGDKDPPGLDKMTSEAAQAAKKDIRFRALASAMTTWAARAKQEAELSKNGFSTMTASQKAELDALQRANEVQYAVVAAECKKARAGR